MTDAPASSDAERRLPSRRAGAPAPGAKRRQYLRYKRIATIASLVVITAVVVLLAGVFQGSAEDPDVAATHALLDDLARALAAHHERVGELPPRISALVNPSSPYRGDPIPEDAWRRLIEYRVLDAKGGTYRLRSLGADGRAGTADDLVRPAGTTWE